MPSAAISVTCRLCQAIIVKDYVFPNLYPHAARFYKDATVQCLRVMQEHMAAKHSLADIFDIQ